jgi:cellulose synthase/poly-beta-1,6-N-acetylglucosamine synthase-like glycosyltransferase
LASASETRVKADTLPPEIAFLSAYGVAPAQLIAAVELARKQGVAPDRALLASGAVTERFFYQSLARHLGLAFIEEPVRLQDRATQTYPQAIRAGIARFDGPAGPIRLAAPRGEGLVALLRAVRRDGIQRAHLAITTPSHLSRCVREAAHRRIAADASYDLLSTNADLCAQGGLNLFQQAFAWIGALVFVLSFMIVPLAAANLWLVAIGFVFFATVLFRLFLSAAVLGVPHRRNEPLEDHKLPNYTIVIALYKEARIVPRLVAMLDCIDYPHAKLDIKFVLEEDDVETRRALESSALAPIYEIIIAPDGQPRTKPRALNIALPLAEGDLCVVFDAEDAPDPQQLRRAAEHFAHSPPRLACLQGRLAIDNARENWLTHLFAIEYAALFHVQNIGLADQGLPLPASGSSNHFRTSVLREIHGWDAWNVTEDADIGLRLARFGYSVGVLDSTTYEEAPVSLKAWFGQRRRWFKGWLQTFVTITRSPATLVMELGVLRTGALALLFLSLLVGPLFWIPSSLFVLIGAISNRLWTPADFSGICLATLWASVTTLGTASLFWYALLGMKRQRLLYLWPALILLLPYYCLHAAAAWMALYELFRRPFHWHKTEHGLSCHARREGAELAGKKALA